MPDDRPQTALVVEDDAENRELLRAMLGEAGFWVAAFGGKAEAGLYLERDCPDVVLLDLGLADGNGLDLLWQLRLHDNQVPVVIVSGRGDAASKIRAFDLGCDDFVTKPFDAAVLAARIRRLLARCRMAGTVKPAGGPLVRGPFEIDPAAMAVRKSGRDVTMRRKLFDILFHLASRDGALVDREELLLRHWGRADEFCANSLYVHIRQLRELVEDDPANPSYIQTVRARGFRFVCPAEHSVKVDLRQ